MDEDTYTYNCPSCNADMDNDGLGWGQGEEETQCASCKAHLSACLTCKKLYVYDYAIFACKSCQRKGKKAVISDTIPAGALPYGLE